MPTFTSFAENILAQAKQLDEMLAHEGRQPTSFDHDTMIGLNPKMEQLRNKLIDTTQTLKRLAQGTEGTYEELLFSSHLTNLALRKCTDEAALRVIYKYKLANFIPLNASASFAEISSLSGLQENLVERFLRQAMSNHIFDESPPGQVVHTAYSRALVEDPGLFDALGVSLFEWSPSFKRMLEALDKWNYSEEPQESAWGLENGSNVSVYQALAAQPERSRRFGAGIAYLGRASGWDLDHLTRNFDWLGADDKVSATFVDIGGGLGTVSQALAKITKNVKFVVQDLPGTCERGLNALPDNLKARVSFTPHDFFTEQPIHGAEIYFLRWILHMWSDEYCIKILRALIPALRPGARVINYEFVVRDAPEHSWTSRRPRNLDVLMHTMNNAAERTERAWKNLFQKADSRLQLQKFTTPKGSMMSIIEAVWTED